MASTQEEADLLISKVEEYGGRINLETKIWGKDSIINCDNLKKAKNLIYVSFARLKSMLFFAVAKICVSFSNIRRM